MKPLIMLAAILFSTSVFAGHACWKKSADGNRSTKAIVELCGIKTNSEAEYCYDYCTGVRSGGISTCNNLCGTYHGGGSIDYPGDTGGGSSGGTGGDSGGSSGGSSGPTANSQLAAAMAGV